MKKELPLYSPVYLDVLCAISNDYTTVTAIAEFLNKNRVGLYHTNQLARLESRGYVINKKKKNERDTKYIIKYDAIIKDWVTYLRQQHKILAKAIGRRATKLFKYRTRCYSANKHIKNYLECSIRGHLIGSKRNIINLFDNFITYQSLVEQMGKNIGVTFKESDKDEVLENFEISLWAINRQRFNYSGLLDVALIKSWMNSQENS